MVAHNHHIWSQLQSHAVRYLHYLFISHISSCVYCLFVQLPLSPYRCSGGACLNHVQPLQGLIAQPFASLLRHTRSFLIETQNIAQYQCVMRYVLLNI
jgi:hypothetical protein